MAKLSATEILKALSQLGGLGPAALPGVAGALALIGGNGAITPGIAAGRSARSPGATVGDVAVLADNQVAKTYPREFYPDSSGHTVDVSYIPGPAQNNAALDAGVARDAARMQTIQEHNDTLLKYVRPGMTPVQLHDALEQGRKDERQLLSFWADSKPRKAYTPSSSAVKGVRITPDSRIEVMWGSNPNKWYTFRQFPNTYEASLEAQKLLMAPSLGRAVMPARIADRSKIAGLGEWNRANYDGSFAK